MRRGGRGKGGWRGRGGDKRGVGRLLKGLNVFGFDAKRQRGVDSKTRRQLGEPASKGNHIIDKKTHHRQRNLVLTRERSVDLETQH